MQEHYKVEYNKHMMGAKEYLEFCMSNYVRSRTINYEHSYCNNSTSKIGCTYISWFGGDSGYG